MRKCKYLEVSEEGRLLCSKMKEGEEVGEEVCAACPIQGEDICQYLRFSLHKDYHFSAVGKGGRIIRIGFERLVCGLEKMPLSSINECKMCPQKVSSAPVTPAPSIVPRETSKISIPKEEEIPRSPKILTSEEYIQEFMFPGEKKEEKIAQELKPTPPPPPREEKPIQSEIITPEKTAAPKENTSAISDDELLKRGWAALVKELGPADATKFIISLIEKRGST
jgi:hypothetical protein